MEEEEEKGGGDEGGGIVSQYGRTSSTSGMLLDVLLDVLLVAVVFVSLLS